MIYLAPFFNNEKINIEAIQVKLYNHLILESKILHLKIDCQSAYFPQRDQYNSTGLLLRLLEQLPEGSSKILGITQLDLCTPILTFVFGEAQLNGSAGVISTYRLQNQFYGLPEDHAILQQRLAKVVIHELSHTFGLYHCRDYQCVMKSSTYVEELDIKPETLCPSCKKLFEDSEGRLKNRVGK